MEAISRGYRITDEGVMNGMDGEINGYPNSKGYKCITIRNRKERTTRMVPFHRIQAYQKFGDKMFEDGIEVRHLNGNRLDNSFENIEIGTSKQNSMDKKPEVRLAMAIHASKFITVHSHQDIVNWYMNNGKSYKKTMLNFGISSKGTLHFILNRSISVKPRILTPQ